MAAMKVEYTLRHQIGTATRGVIWLVALLFIAGFDLHAQTLTQDAEGVVFTNTTKATMVNLRIGNVTLARVKPNTSITVNAQVDETPHGRFSTSSWPATTQFTHQVASFHLRTAGYFLDAISPGRPGHPSEATNLVALQRLDDRALDGWRDRPLEWRLLVTHGARYAQPAFVARLLTLTQPTEDDTSRVKGYEMLPSVADSVRLAIEAHGPTTPILKALKTHPQWRQDRGLSDLRVIDSLLGRPTQLGKDTQSGLVEARTHLKSAIESANMSKAAAAAVTLALSKQVTKSHESRASARMGCATLDTVATQHRRAKRWLATEGYLRLAIVLCGDKRTLRDRIAGYYRARAESHPQALDLAMAADWLRAAYWIGDDARDKAFLADTNAELAIILFRTGDHAGGRDYLRKARAFGAFRPRVLTAGEFEPETDPRARVAVAVVIIFLTVFAYRRLRRVLFGRANIGADTLNRQRRM